MHRQELENLSLNQLIVEIMGGNANEDEMQVEKATVLSIKPESHGGLGILVK